MIEISPGQTTPTLKSFFDPRDPAGLRCIAVLERIHSGPQTGLPNQEGIPAADLGKIPDIVNIGDNYM